MQSQTLLGLSKMFAFAWLTAIKAWGPRQWFSSERQTQELQSFHLLIKGSNKGTVWKLCCAALSLSVIDFVEPCGEVQHYNITLDYFHNFPWSSSIWERKQF